MKLFSRTVMRSDALRAKPMPLVFRRARAMKVAAGKIFFKWRGADDDAVDFNGGAGRSAGDGEFAGRYTNGHEQKNRAERKRVEAHGDDPCEVYYS